MSKSLFIPRAGNLIGCQQRLCATARPVDRTLGLPVPSISQRATWIEDRAG